MTNQKHITPFSQDPPAVTFHVGVGLVVHNVVVDEPSVEAEALRWTTGTRGEPITLPELEGADLGAYHRTAFCLGSRVLQAAGDNTSSISLSGTVLHLADRAEAAAGSLLEDARRAAVSVMETATKAAQDATEATAKLIEDTTERFDKQVGDGVNEAMDSMRSELARLLGPDGGAAMVAIREIVAKAMGEANGVWHKTLTTSLTEVSKVLDVNNPSSPLGAMERRLGEQHARQYTELITKIDRVQETVRGAAEAARTAAAIRDAQLKSPAKGRPYEEAVGTTLESIAAGIGAAYIETANRVGAVKSSKKGDGVLEKSLDRPDLSARVVVEYTTGQEVRSWPEYLEQAQKNRVAQAALGLVPRAELVPGGHALALIRPHQMILAFDPERDDASLLRASAQLLLVQAERRLSDDRTGDLKLADARLEEACQRLAEMADVIKTAITVRQNATRIVSSLEGLHVSLALCIEQARSALAVKVAGV